MEAYAKQADPSRKLIILSYVGVWTKVSAWHTENFVTTISHHDSEDVTTRLRLQRHLTHCCA